MRRILKIASVYLGFTGLAAAQLLVYSFPIYPKTLAGWALFFILALPVTIAMELACELIWRNKLAKWVDARSEGISTSPLRIMYLLLAMFLLFAVILGIGVFFNHNLLSISRH